MWVRRHSWLLQISGGRHHTGVSAVTSPVQTCKIWRSHQGTSHRPHSSLSVHWSGHDQQHQWQDQTTFPRREQVLQARRFYPLWTSSSKRTSRLSERRLGAGHRGRPSWGSDCATPSWEWSTQHSSLSLSLFSGLLAWHTTSVREGFKNSCSVN